MKTFTLFIATLLCMFTYTEGFALSSDSKAAHITFKAETNGKKIYFQSESDTIYGYQEVKPGETYDDLEKTANMGKYLLKETMRQSINLFNSILPYSKALIV